MILVNEMHSEINQTNIEKIYQQFGVEKVDLKTIHTFDNALALKVSEEMCQYHHLVPITVSEKGILRLAMAEPFDMLAQEIVRSKTGLEVDAVWSSGEDIDFAMGQIFSEKARFEDTLQELVEVEDEGEEAELEEESIDLLRSQASDAPAVVFVNSLLVQAVQERASDIHIEPQEKDLRIRLRIDGMLREFPPASKRLQKSVIARIKILADLDIAEQRVPQDGRVKFKIMGRSVDVRVSTMPGIYGEKIVLRILDKGSTSLNIDDLGIDPSSLARFKEAAKSAHGMVLITGPTGSGKTTTLYSVLNFVNSPALNVITVEDPVEYRLAGINQIQTRPNVGLTFASALRSILRQDPDIVMVGEIRDLETAEIAIKAALTGHLVLSTLHTNDAVATIIRLLNMGIDKYLIVSSIAVIIAQRLVRRVCLNCKKPVVLSKEMKINLKNKGIIYKGLTFYHGKGCKQCSGTGYWGRIAIHEVLFLDGEIKELIIQDKSEIEIRKKAEAGGMTILLQDGLNKAAQGLTTTDEIIRVI
ncbi:MAG: type II/IV secretion system protein [Candidatus Marinimicrobia bacterium]|nr:type II/IV secretion system protein [Candidatus Neomarinimicrobiota bacterium]